MEMSNVSMNCTHDSVTDKDIAINVWNCSINNYGVGLEWGREGVEGLGLIVRESISEMTPGAF